MLNVLMAKIKKNMSWFAVCYRKYVLKTERL